jgi:hypothetical protein
LALDEIDRETPDHVRRAERASVAPGGASAGERG